MSNIASVKYPGLPKYSSSCTSATELSKLGLNALVPKPRMNTCGEPMSCASTRTFGMYCEMSARLAAPVWRTKSPPIAVIEIGTLRADWRVFCAVTMTSSR